MSQSLLDPNSNDNGSTLFKFSICNGIKEKKTNFGRLVVHSNYHNYIHHVIFLYQVPPNLYQTILAA